MPSRVQGQSGFEAAVNPCRHWTGDGKTGKSDCANGWTALFIKVRGALLDKLGLAEDDDMPLKLAQENPTLLKALVEAKSDAPPCLDAAGIQKVREFVRRHAEGVVLALLPTQDASEPSGFDSPAARGNLSGYDMRLDDWSSAPGALEKRTERMCAAVVKGRVAPAAARCSAFGPTQVSGASHRPPFAASNAGPRIRLSTLGTRLLLHPAGQPTGWREFAVNATERASPGCDFAGTKEAPAQVSRSQMRRYRLFSFRFAPSTSSSLAPHRAARLKPSNSA